VTRPEIPAAGPAAKRFAVTKAIKHTSFREGKDDDAMVWQ
jgi:hypothetical protein